MDQNRVLCNGIQYGEENTAEIFRSFLETGRMAPYVEQRLLQKHSEMGMSRVMNMEAVSQVLTVQDYKDIVYEVMKGREMLRNMIEELDRWGEPRCLLMNRCLIYAAANNPLCYPVINRIYQTHPVRYQVKTEESSLNDGRFYAHFGPEEVLYARRLVGMFEYIRTAEEGHQGAVYDQLTEMFVKGWQDIYRALRNKTEVSFSYVNSLMLREPENQNRTRYCRMEITLILLELLEIKKEGRYWLNIHYEIMGHVERYLAGEKPNLPEPERNARRIRKKLEKKQPDARKGAVVAERCRLEEGGFGKMGELFRLGGLDADALYPISVTEKEAEKIIELGKIEDEKQLDEFLSDMATVCLCKMVARCKELLIDYDDRKSFDSLRKKGGEVRAEECQLEEIRKNLVYYQEETERLGCLVMETERQYESDSRRAQSQLEKYESEHQELVALRDFVYQLQQDDEGEAVQGQKEERHKLESLSVLVFGGHPSWQSKMRQILPGWKYIPATQRSFDLRCMGQYQYLVINVKMMKHSIYYKILAEKDRYQKMVFVNGNNVERCIRQIADQIH